MEFLTSHIDAIITFLITLCSSLFIVIRRTDKLEMRLDSLSEKIQESDKDLKEFRLELSQNISSINNKLDTFLNALALKQLEK